MINKLLHPTAIDPEQVKSFIFSVEEFRDAVVRERYLSDRNNHGYSLVHFEVPAQQNDPDTDTGRLAAILVNRKRDVDIVGRHHSKNAMSVLLPDTDNVGARHFTQRIFRELKADIPGLRHNISTYPTDNWGELHSPAPVSEDTYSSITEDAYSTFIANDDIPIWKRSLDVFGAVFGLIMLSPLFAAVALLVKIVSPGPVLYTQERVGRFGKTFHFYKFRTMAMDNDESVHKSYLKELIKTNENDGQPMRKIENDTRVIPFGNFLRKSCIDELPQLFNVLAGDMSLVGPRPCIPYEAEEYLRWHARRFDIIPGMTGLWQVNGKNRTTFKEMIRYDIQYAATASVWLDIFIILKTPFAIVSQAFDKQTTEKKEQKRVSASNSVKRSFVAEIT